MSDFSPEVYEQIRAGTQASAAVIVPMILAHLTFDDAGPRPFTPEVIDVGCGEGWWSQAFQHHGCHVRSIDQAAPPVTAHGVDVLPVDLEAASFTLERNAYDLAVCLEVAEHLSIDAGEHLVAELCYAARYVAFSAAIPGQGGHGHHTERWPTYWAALFAEHGYMLVDPWRRALWEEPGVEPWYAQNLLLAQRSTGAELDAPSCLVHPTIYLARVHDRDYWRETALEAQREAARFRERLIVLPGGEAS